MADKRSFKCAEIRVYSRKSRKSAMINVYNYSGNIHDNNGVSNTTASSGINYTNGYK